MSSAEFELQRWKLIENSYFRVNCIARNKVEALRLIVKHLLEDINCGHDITVQTVNELLLRENKIGSTGVGGIAFPHIILSRVKLDNPRFGWFQFNNAIDFDSADGSQVNLILCALLSSKEDLPLVGLALERLNKSSYRTSLKKSHSHDSFKTIINKLLWDDEIIETHKLVTIKMREENHCKKVEIVNKLGLHARCSTFLSNLAAIYYSDIKMRAYYMNHDGKPSDWINAKSVLAVLSLAVEKGDVIEIVAEGSDSKDAIKALEQMIVDKFNED